MEPMPEIGLGYKEVAMVVILNIFFYYFTYGAFAILGFYII